MSRWKRLTSERLIATTLVLFATSVGGLAGCEDPGTIGNTGGMGGGGGSESCMPQDDKNDCTTDACDTNGMQLHTPVAAGTTCSNGGSVCDADGACVMCLDASDCPGTDDACQTRTCTMGACGFDYTPLDTAVPMQTAGDCKLTVCDGNGAQIDNNDDNDLPDDSNACTDDVCTAGVASNPNLTQGSDCTPQGGTDPLVCNDMGQCVGCNTGADCPGTDDECSTRTCDMGVCGVSFTAADTPVMAQTDNDCLVHVCDGAGNFVDIADDVDLPLDDGNPCTDETCSMGAPNHPDLADGSTCDDGDLCTPMDTCQMGTCTAGMAITCTASDQCHVAGVCDPMTGVCSDPAAMDGIPCDDANLCTQTDACSAGTCTGANPVVCSASDQCHVAGTCDTMTGICSNPAAMDGASCDDGNPCTQTDACSAGSCAGANPVVCSASDQCHVAGTCDSMTGTCSNPAAMDGAMCTSNMTPGACTMGACVACGDGIIGGAETCDDGNATAGDGCNATCAAESGWVCTGAPSVCATVCGDGFLRGTEVCDDGNMTSGDGCSSACQLDISCAAGEVPVIITNSTSGAIPDNAQGGIASLTNVTQTGVVRKVIPTINVTHPNTGHVDTWLISPYGVERELATDVGSSANFTATTFSDAAATLITAGTAPYSGTFGPENTISDAAGFATQSANGQWSLRVGDDTSTLTGTLNSWSLALCIDPAVANNCGNGYVEPNEQCDDGNAIAGDGCSASCQLEITCAGNETLVFMKSTSLPQIIPGGDAAGITSSINISNVGVVGKAVVVVNSISHTWDGDLSLSLTSPGGTTLDLSSGNGSSNDNFVSTIFDDAAATSITVGTAPYRGWFTPEAALSGVVAQPTNGNWTFTAVDALAADAGHLNSWSLALCVAPMPICGNNNVEPGEGCDDGATMPGDGCSSSCTVEPGWQCTGSPSVCTVSCGNGTLEMGEECDDGGTMSNDGCSNSCTVEADYACTTAPSMCAPYETNCNDGLDNDGDGDTDDVDSDCTLPAYFPGCAAGEALRVYRAFDTPQSIPDNLPAGTTSTVRVVNNIGTIASTAMLFDITHTYDGDLDITLISPANVSFDVTSDNGVGGDNYTSTILASGCPTVTGGTPPFSGCYAPEASLAPLTGTSAQGAWKLNAADDVGTDTGTLNSWKLVFCIAP